MDVVSGDERGTTERVLTLLGLLQQRQVWTGPELADRLGVTPRTVRRDVERLRTLGYPVHASQGVGGGYQLGPGEDLPPLLLDDEEAIATAVSLLAGAVASAGDAALRALTKLDRVLPTRLRHEVRALSGSVESFGGGRTPVDPEVLMTLARACRDEVEAGFDYPSGSEVRRRRVPLCRGCLVGSGSLATVMDVPHPRWARYVLPVGGLAMVWFASALRWGIEGGLRILGRGAVQ
jgi:predicted DNA-binding transcriptional regulator YafY